MRRALLATSLLLLAGCPEGQSALHPMGEEAARIEGLLWVLTAFSVAVTALVVVTAAVAVAGPARWRARLSTRRFIVGWGVVFPVVSLSVLLVGSLLLWRAPADADAARIRVEFIGERWWWRARYHGPDGATFETANELVVPVGEPVLLELTTADVLHSFWAPTLAGKLDMIPGRTNRMTVTATVPGWSRGQCAEYCGGAHALMGFDVRALAPADFEAWMREQARPASGGEGARVFRSAGCAACHVVRGVTEVGSLGPDLTHMASRRSLAAATLPNTEETLASWIRDAPALKPEALMPPYRGLSPDEIDALVTWLGGLE